MLRKFLVLPVQKCSAEWNSESSKLLTKRVDVSQSDFDSDFGTRFDVHRVLVVDRLNVPERRVNFRELREKGHHLANLELTDVSVTRVTLLLGSDAPEAIVPLEIRFGPKGSPVVVRTKLGWTVTGRLPGYIEVLHETVKTG